MPPNPSDMLFCCPVCNQQLKARYEYAGQITHCPACRKQARIPSSVPLGREQPVFLDLSNARWFWIRYLGLALGMAFLGLLVFLGANIVTNPVLPPLSLGDAGGEPAKRSAPDQAGAPLRLPAIAGASSAGRTGWSGLSAPPMPAEKAPGKEMSGPDPDRGASARPLTMAFAVTWDVAARNSFRENLDRLDIVIPEWLYLAEDGGVHQLKFEFSRMLSSAPAGPRFVPALVNRDPAAGWLGKQTGALLAAASARAKLIAGLMEYARAFPVHGFCVDFQDLPPDLLPNYFAFLGELAARLHAAEKVLYVCAPREFTPSACRRIAAAADLVLVMAQAQHAAAGAPGPLAAEDWFENIIRRHAAEIPPAKLGIVFGSYACDWPASGQGGGLETFEEALLAAREKQAAVRMDAAALNPVFGYQDARSRRHAVWMLDAVTAFNQVVAAQKLNPRALVLWRLGSEDAALWRFFGRALPPGAQVDRLLAEVEFKSAINFAGQGEIIRIAGAAAPGARRLTFDERRGLIAQGEYAQLPAPYLVRRYGAAGKKVALTFDDGPDPAYTPAILEILARERAPATFFVVGANVQLYPGLLKRIAREGHEIGNHTFTHPNIARIMPGQLGRELTAMQRLLEGLVGRRTLLFRPPFGEDTDPATPEELRSLEIVSRLGYWTVGMHLDPRDWQSPPAPEIVRRTLAQVQQGEGNIVLLHDSGGDRASTVAALPELIRRLRSGGCELVAVSQLLGCTRDDVMPPLNGAQQVPATLNGLVFGLARLLVNSLTMLFLLGIVVGLARLLFIGLLAGVDALRKRRAYYSCHYRPTVAVIVPSYNEEKVICKTISSLLSSTDRYPLEIIVVDDGSADQTYQRAFDAFGRHPAVRIFKKSNGGKASALNFGIAQIKADIVVAMDADTVFAPDTIWKLVRHFDDKRVGAVAGNAKVGNRINLLTKWQALEYIASQNLERRAFDVLGCITVVPGAVGAWRRELVARAGGFGQATLAEDADLTIAIRRLGYSIVNEDEAHAFTEAPDTLRGLVRQRCRWMYGTLQAAWKHKRALFNPRYGALGFVGLPSIFVFQILFPLISPAIDLLAAWTLGRQAWNLLTGAGVATEALLTILAWYLLFTAADFAVVLLAFRLEPKEDQRLLWWIFPQRFCYRQLMYYVALKSALTALRGVEVGWGKLKRKATVAAGGPGSRR